VRSTYSAHVNLETQNRGKIFGLLAKVGGSGEREAEPAEYAVSKVLERKNIFLN